MCFTIGICSYTCCWACVWLRSIVPSGSTKTLGWSHKSGWIQSSGGRMPATVKRTYTSWWTTRCSGRPWKICEVGWYEAGAFAWGGTNSGASSPAQHLLRWRLGNPGPQETPSAQSPSVYGHSGILQAPDVRLLLHPAHSAVRKELTAFLLRSRPRMCTRTCPEPRSLRHVWLPQDHPLYSSANKKVLGKLKDECAGRAIAEYVGLRPKMYSILEAGGKNTKKAQGVKKNVEKKHIRHEQYKESLFEKQAFRHSMVSCGQSAIASTSNIWTRSLSHPSTPSAGSQKLGWTRWNMDTGMRSLRDVKPAGERRLRTPSGGSCVSDGTTSSSSRTKPRPAGSTTRASQPIHLKRPRRVSSPPATTLQFTGLVKVANTYTRGDFLFFEAKRASRVYRGGLLFQRLGLDGIIGLFASQPGHFSIQSCDNRGQPLHLLCGTFTGWESHLLGILVPEEAFSQRPVEALHDALVPVDVNPTAPNLDRVLC